MAGEQGAVNALRLLDLAAQADVQVTLLVI
jgi:hypothetical protein